MIQFREMTRQDVAQVAKLEKETFSTPWTEQDFIEMIDADYAYYLVVEEDGAIIGGCGLRNIVGEGEITNVVIHPRYRNRGIGMHMLSRLLEDGEKMGIQAFTLEVRESNAPAIHLYERIGFQPEGMRKDFYQNPTEDAVIMWKR